MKSIVNVIYMLNYCTDLQIYKTNETKMKKHKEILYTSNISYNITRNKHGGCWK